MLFSGKENVFMCLVAFQKIFRKIFSDVWLCSWKYHRKHIFYLFLTFSRLPNEYIISFIPQNTNKTQKKIIKSGHFARSRSARSALRTIGVVPVMSADDIGELGFGRYRRARLWTISTLSSFFLPLSLSLALSLFCAWPGSGLKVKWKCKTISESKALNFGQTEIIFRKFYFS